MKRIAVTVVGLVVLAGVAAYAQGEPGPLAWIEVAEKWIDLHDASALPPMVVGEAIAAPSVLILASVSDEEAAALTAAGTVIYEPRTRIRSDAAGNLGFGEGAGIDLVARSGPGDTIALQVSIQMPDGNANAGAPLALLLRVADGETVGLARVGEDGEISGPLCLLTARVVEDRPPRAAD